MSCIVTSLTFLFMLASIGAQFISFLTSYMVVNRFAPGLHDGLFQRCGALEFFQTSINSAGSFVSKSLDGSVRTFTSCYWWNSDMFGRDDRALQACVVLSFISLGILGLTLIFFMISLIERFKTRALYSFLGFLMSVNALVIVSIILIYSFAFAKEAKIMPDANSPVLFSWSYWILFAAATGNFLTAILFCCNYSRSTYD